MGVNLFDINDYDNQVQRFKELSIANNKTISCGELRNNNLPDSRWYIKNCPDTSVTTWGGFVDWCGFYSKGHTSKEKAVDLIYKKANKLNRPLCYDDFREIGCYEVPMTYIRNTWGTMNKMKKELGLEIIQEDMTSKTLTRKVLDKELNKIRQYIIDNNLPYITRRLIDNLSFIDVASSTLDKCCKKYYNKTLGEYFRSAGIIIGENGCGTIFLYEDGEKTLSQYEYLFSRLLKNFGLIYNYDYFRDVRYSEFISSYFGYMDCDYLLKYDNREIYIEIPGIIASYKQWYYSNKPITASKSKDDYCKKLKYKEQLFIDNNLEYILLFPSDITRENLMLILNNPCRNVRDKIEKEYKHNIQWDKVIDIGELKYTQEISRDGQRVVDYSA